MHLEGPQKVPLNESLADMIAREEAAISLMKRRKRK
jgi:hypothetical protein